MFLSVVYPGLIFFFGCFFLSETPRWLFQHGRPDEALRALRTSTSEEEAMKELREMETLTAQNHGIKASGLAGSLLRRKYVSPFVLACTILACNQATGINSILSYLVIILKEAGMSARNATQASVTVTLLNCVMTALAVALVDRKGRKFLLMVGTAGIIVALASASVLFHFEDKQIDVKQEVQGQVRGDTLTHKAEVSPDYETSEIELTVVNA